LTLRSAAIRAVIWSASLAGGAGAVVSCAGSAIGNSSASGASDSASARQAAQPSMWALVAARSSSVR